MTFPDISSGSFALWKVESHALHRGIQHLTHCALNAYRKWTYCAQYTVHTAEIVWEVVC